MTILNHDYVVSGMRRATAPSAGRLIRLNVLLLMLAVYLGESFNASALSQENVADGESPQNRRRPFVQLLRPTFQRDQSGKPTAHRRHTTRTRQLSATNRPPQHVRQPIQRRQTVRREVDTHIVQTSHTPAPAGQIQSSAVPAASIVEHNPPQFVGASINDYAPCDECVLQERTWQVLPDGLMYKSYLAGEKESRFSAVWLHEEGRGWVWETTLGGRVGLLRYGTRGAVKPQGWQLDIEGAAFPRIDPEESSQMDSVDFRAGCISTWRNGPLAVKAGYYHISSHIGDEFLLRNPTFPRIEYVRDSAILGMTYDINDALTTYGEVGYAVGHTGGAEPLEFQFGLEYSPRARCNWRGAPFAAINGHLREDFDFGGNLTIVAGRQWRGPESDHLFRAGLMYFNGKSLQYQFFNKHEELVGAGIWFDF